MIKMSKKAQNHLLAAMSTASGHDEAVSNVDHDPISNNREITASNDRENTASDGHDYDEVLHKTKDRQARKPRKSRDNTPWREKKTAKWRIADEKFQAREKKWYTACQKYTKAVEEFLKEDLSMSDFAEKASRFSKEADRLHERHRLIEEEAEVLYPQLPDSCISEEDLESEEPQ